MLCNPLDLALIGLGASLSGSPPPTRRGTVTLYPEEDDVSLAIDDEALAQKLSCRTEAASKGCSGLSFTGGELPSPASLQLVDIAHVLAHQSTALAS